MIIDFLNILNNIILITNIKKRTKSYRRVIVTRGGTRAAATSKMARFVIIVNGFQLLTIITKRSSLDVAAVLDPPLVTRSILETKFRTLKVSEIFFPHCFHPCHVLRWVGFVQ